MKEMIWVGKGGNWNAISTDFRARLLGQKTLSLCDLGEVSEISRHLSFFISEMDIVIVVATTFSCED